MSSSSVSSEDLLASYQLLREGDLDSLLDPVIRAEGGELVSLSREDLGYRPGREVFVRCRAQVARGGEIHTEGWVFRAGAPLGDRTTPLVSSAGALSCWRVRDDPALPGLRSILDQRNAEALVEGLGLDPRGCAVALRTIRPLRRAVVELRTPTHRLFVKCVAPRGAAELHQRHRAAAAAGLPVPQSFGSDPTLGIVVLAPVEGDSLRERLLSQTGPLPEPRALVDLLGRFGEVKCELPGRDMLAHAQGHLRLLRHILPEAGSALDRLGPAISDTAQGAARVIHGDCYDAQILCRTTGAFSGKELEAGESFAEVSGVVDLDGLGLGDPAADAGNFLAHLYLLQIIAPSRALSDFTSGMCRELVAEHTPERLGSFTAAGLVGLATWPHSQNSSGWEKRTHEIIALAQSQILS